MAVFRQTWFFEGPGGSTWEEVWDVDASSIAVATPAPSDNIVLNRMALAHNTVNLLAIESRSIDNPDDPPVRPAINVAGSAKDAEGAPANQGEAAVLSIVCATSGGKKASRKLWMRGLPEESVTRAPITGRPILSGAFSANLDVWLQSLEKSAGTTRKYGMRPRVRSAYGGAIPRWDITAVAAGAQANLTVLTTGGNHGIEKNQLVQINAANQKKLPGLKGVFRVVDKTATSITVAYRLPYIPSDPSGYFYFLSRPDFYTVKAASSGFAFLGTRQTKKPGSRSRGRRSAVRLRR